MTLEQIKADARTIRKTSARLWYEANHELVKQQSRQYKEENPDLVKLQNQKYRVQNRRILNTKNRIRTRNKKIKEFQALLTEMQMKPQNYQLRKKQDKCERNIKQLVSDIESDAKLLSELEMEREAEKEEKRVAAETKTAEATGEQKMVKYRFLRPATTKTRQNGGQPKYFNREEGTFAVTLLQENLEILKQDDDQFKVLALSLCQKFEIWARFKLQDKVEQKLRNIYKNKMPALVRAPGSVNLSTFQNDSLRNNDFSAQLTDDSLGINTSAQLTDDSLGNDSSAQLIDDPLGINTSVQVTDDSDTTTQSMEFPDDWPEDLCVDEFNAHLNAHLIPLDPQDSVLSLLGAARC